MKYEYYCTDPIRWGNRGWSPLSHAARKAGTCPHCSQPLDNGLHEVREAEKVTLTWGGIRHKMPCARCGFEGHYKLPCSYRENGRYVQLWDNPPDHADCRAFWESEHYRTWSASIRCTACQNLELAIHHHSKASDFLKRANDAYQRRGQKTYILRKILANGDVE